MPRCGGQGGRKLRRRQRKHIKSQKKLDSSLSFRSGVVSAIQELTESLSHSPLSGTTSSSSSYDYPYTSAREQQWRSWQEEERRRAQERVERARKEADRVILDRRSHNGSRGGTALEEQRLRLASESPALEFERFREVLERNPYLAHNGFGVLLNLT